MEEGEGLFWKSSGVLSVSMSRGSHGEMQGLGDPRIVRMRSCPGEGFAAKIIGRPQRLGPQPLPLLLPRGALWPGKEPRRFFRDRIGLTQVPPVIPEIVDPVRGSLPAEVIPD